MSFCNASSGWFDLRKIVYDYHKEISAVVIALPPMLQPATNVPLCLVSFFKSDKDIIVLADVTGEEFSVHQDLDGGKNYTLKVQSIVETIQKANNAANNVWTSAPENWLSTYSPTPEDEASQTQDLIETNTYELFG
jgi:hypothetical protein